MNLEYTRAMRLAAGVSAQSEETLVDHLQRTKLLVTFDPGEPDLAATALIITETARRLPLRVAVASRDTATASIIATTASAIDPVRGVEAAAMPGPDFHVHIGTARAGADLVARPERHGARLSTRSVSRRATESASGLGAMTCAALAGAEIFKRIAAVVPERGRLHCELAWCPVTLGSDPLAAPAVSELSLELALVGLGAIGTAIVRILDALPARGRLLLVDPQRFAQENVGTYSIGTADDATNRPWKVDLATAALPKFKCRAFRHPVDELIEAVDTGHERWPGVILSGLDSPDARRATQRLWPDRLIDGATGDTMCGLHDVVADKACACLMCLFPVRGEGPSAADRLAAVTGLPAELLRDGDQLLQAEHVRGLPADKRTLVEEHVGKPICGLARATGLTALESDGYMPSVPFVSQQAACMVVGRLLACELGVEPQPRFVQHDALIGPQAATFLDRDARPDCYCQERARVIESVRSCRRPAA